MRVELSVHATKLKNVAGAFKGCSDPFAVATHMPSTPGEKPRVLGKTEVIKSENLNAENQLWEKKLEYKRLEMGQVTPAKFAQTPTPLADVATTITARRVVLVIFKADVDNLIRISIIICSLLVDSQLSLHMYNR